jgi:uncharacterized protein
MTTETSPSTGTWRAVARITELWLFPVKSMAGTRVDSARVTAHGLAGDRSWAVVDNDGKPVTAADEPRLRLVTPRLVDGQLLLDVPDAAPGLGPDEASAALSQWLGRDLRLASQETGSFADVAPVHVVSTTSMSDATHAEECDTCDISAPRANFVLALGDGETSERDWVGRTVRAGDAELTMAKLPKHCLGIYADVPRGGTLSVGDELLA